MYNKLDVDRFIEEELKHIDKTSKEDEKLVQFFLQNQKEELYPLETLRKR